MKKLTREFIKKQATSYGTKYQIFYFQEFWKLWIGITDFLRVCF